MPRFSLRTLLAVTSLFALAAFAAGSDIAWLLSDCALLASLTAATLAAAFATGRDRAFFFGFAVAGWAMYVETHISHATGIVHVERLIEAQAQSAIGTRLHLLPKVIRTLSVVLVALAGGWFTVRVYRKYREPE